MIRETNAERIRKMNDSELSQFIADFYSCLVCDYHDEEHDCCASPHNFVCVKQYAYSITEKWLKGVS